MEDLYQDKKGKYFEVIITKAAEIANDDPRIPYLLQNYGDIFISPHNSDKLILEYNKETILGHVRAQRKQKTGNLSSILDQVAIKAQNIGAAANTAEQIDQSIIATLNQIGLDALKKATTMKSQFIADLAIDRFRSGSFEL